jgi:hypothetical protein
MDEKCVLTCDLNYENSSQKTYMEYMCVPKACEDRTPWENGSCTTKEDFASGVQCYLSRAGDDGVENCVEKEECPAGYPGVCVIVIYT